MKDLSEDVIHSFPGFDKILEPFKDTGDSKVKKDLKKPMEDPHFSGNTNVSDTGKAEPKMSNAYNPTKKVAKKKNKKARKKLKESINNFRNHTMKSQKNKFDELFENVMGDEDLDLGLGAGDAGDMDLGADQDLGGEMPEGEAGEHSDLHAQIDNIIDQLNTLKASLESHAGNDEDAEEAGDEAEEEGEEGLEDADEGYEQEEGMDTAGEAVVSEPEPKAHNPQPAINSLTGKGNKVTASGYTASSGKADAGKIPNVQADPKAHNPNPAISALTGKSNKPNSKLNKPGAELFKV